MKRIIYEVGRWPCYLHREARGLEMASPVDSPLLQFQDELFERLYAGEAELLPEGAQDGRWAEWAKAVHQACEQLPAFHRLADETRGDADAAALAVEELVDQLGDSIQKLESEQPKDDEVRRAIRVGTGVASAAIEELRDAMAGLAQVMLPGTSGQERRNGEGRPNVGLALKLRSDPRLRRIAKLAGRFTRIAEHKRRTKVRHGAEEITDVELGNDVGRLLPSELVKLRHPRLHKLALRDLVERKAMQYALSGKDRLGKGPLVLLLDRSGSMEGDKDTWSMAVALALAGVAQAEGRTFGLVAFTNQVEYEAVIRPGERLSEDALNLGCCGDTNIDRAVERGLELVEQHPGRIQEADLVLITDGVSIPDRAVELKTRASKLGATILGIGIGVERQNLEPWCDVIETITDLDTVADGAANALFTGRN